VKRQEYTNVVVDETDSVSIKEFGGSWAGRVSYRKLRWFSQDSLKEDPTAPAGIQIPCSPKSSCFLRKQGISRCNTAGHETGSGHHSVVNPTCSPHGLRARRVALTKPHARGAGVGPQVEVRVVVDHVLQECDGGVRSGVVELVVWEGDGGRVAVPVRHL
jgi:hypothetical protein